MNREEIYNILKEKGMYGPIMVWNESHRKRNPFYTSRFVLNYERGQYNCHIETDWGYITDVEEVHLYGSKMHMEGKLTDMRVYINYKDISKFEVNILEE